MKRIVIYVLNHCFHVLFRLCMKPVLGNFNMQYITVSQALAAFPEAILWIVCQISYSFLRLLFFVCLFFEKRKQRPKLLPTCQHGIFC